MDEYSPQEVADLIITQVDGDRVTVSDKNPEAPGFGGRLCHRCLTPRRVQTVPFAVGLSKQMRDTRSSGQFQSQNWQVDVGVSENVVYP